MGLSIGVATDSGLSLSVIVQQVNIATGGLQNIWDDVNQTWSANPTDANAKIALAEQAGARNGYYHGQRLSLGTYTGEINLYVVNNGTNKTIGAMSTYLNVGQEISVGGLLQGTASMATQNPALAIMAKTDTIVSGGATEANVTSVGTNVSTLLTRLTATRAGYLDNLTNLDAAISTRSVPGSLATLNGTERTAIVTAIDSGSTKLGAIHSKLPSTAYLTGTTSSAGAVDIDAAIGNRNAYKADVSNLATMTALTTVGNNVIAILADTNELQTDWVNGGRLDTLLDTAAAGGGGGGGSAPTTGQIVAAIDATSTLAANVIAVKAKTDLISGAPALETTAQAIKTKTDTIVAGGATAAAVTSVANAVATITAKLPSKSFLAGTANSDGDIQADEATGDKSAYKADVSLLALQSTLTAVKAKTDNLPTAPANEVTVTAVKAKTDLISGAPALEATSQAVKAKTDLISGAPALETTAQAIKTKTDTIVAGGATAAALTAVAGNVTSILADTNELQIDWANGGRLDTLLDQAAGGGAAQVFATKTPPRDYTWVIRNDASPLANNIITVGAGSSVLVAMDFARLLPAEVGVLTADSAVCQLLPGQITITGVVKSQDADSAVFTVSGLTAGNRHKLKVTVTTTDNQQLVGYGYLEVI